MTAVQRAILVMAIASTAALIVVWFAPWQLTIVVAWDAGAVWFVASVWLAVRTLDATQTQAVALREDDSRVVAHALLVTASLMSLVGVALDLVKGDQLEGFGKALLTTFGLFTVVAAWAVVHTVFALRYAHEYYSQPPGGIDFKSEDYRPDYQDFAYVAFTIGMTFQISDTDIQQARIRRTVLRHALLSYLFGAVILAVTVNIIAGFL